jgi:hypothetical protein
MCTRIDNGARDVQRKLNQNQKKWNPNRNEMISLDRADGDLMDGSFGG